MQEIFGVQNLKYQKEKLVFYLIQVLTQNFFLTLTILTNRHETSNSQSIATNTSSQTATITHKLNIEQRRMSLRAHIIRSFRSSLSMQDNIRDK